MKKHLKAVVLAVVLAAAFAVGASVSAAGGLGGGSSCWTICCDNGFPCITCCKGQACPDVICP